MVLRYHTKLPSDCPSPNTSALEKYFYPSAEGITKMAYKLVRGKRMPSSAKRAIAKSDGRVEKV